MAPRARNGRRNGGEELTREEGRALFDRTTQRYLHISGDEFLRRYDAGEFDQVIDDTFELRRIEMMIPLGR